MFARFLSKGNQLFIAYSQKEAIEIIKKEKRFDIIFLDHDLGGKIYVNSQEDNTGWWVAKYISENNIKCPQIIVHTMNYAGAKNMLGLLKSAKHIPFMLLIDKFKLAGEIH